MMTFYAAAREAIELAKKEGKLFYVFGGASAGFYTSPEHGKNWLFKVYPGGRKILSMRGKDFV